MVLYLNEYNRTLLIWGNISLVWLSVATLLHLHYMVFKTIHLMKVLFPCTKIEL